MNKNQYEILQDAPAISPEVKTNPRKVPNSLPIASLPALLQKALEVLDDSKERDSVLYSILVALSAIMTKVWGTYKQKTCYPNMFLMVLAPAATGKGSILFAKQLIQPIHQHFIEESKRQLQIFERQPKRTRGNPPPFKVVFIPANSSSSKLLQHLSDNSPETPALLFESEMDTVSITIGSDFGNYSDVMRKVFHNEPVAQTRRTNDEYIDVESPKLAIVLSGTPGQLLKFINNREDGLLSRFLVMSFNNNLGWESVSPCPDCINLTAYFRELSKEYFKLWEFISKDELEVTLSAEQWISLETYCEGKYEEISELYHTDATSLIKRHGIMLYKICLVLTGIRKYEQNISLDTMVCDDDDFSTALYLIDNSLYSSLEIYEKLPAVKSISLQNDKEVFYKALPWGF